jgi:transcription termination factor Rho
MVGRSAVRTAARRDRLMRVDVTLCRLFQLRRVIDPPAKSPASSRMLRLMRQSANECGRLSAMTSGRIIIGWRVGT